MICKHLTVINVFFTVSATILPVPRCTSISRLSIFLKKCFVKSVAAVLSMYGITNRLTSRQAVPSIESPSTLLLPPPCPRLPLVAAEHIVPRARRQNASSYRLDKTPHTMLASMPPFRFIFVALCALALYTIAVFHATLKAASLLPSVRPSVEAADVPELFIFRRTRKTGSSSMAEALLTALGPSYAYTALPFRYADINRAIRLAYVRRDANTSAKRLLIVNHNDVTRNYHPAGAAVIADTVRDGFAQMSSYCRHIRGARDCAADLEACLRSPDARKQVAYRWAGREAEDDETYIDLPLSASHAMLSTAVLRTVFPRVPPLQIDYYNIRNSSCAQTARLRFVYNALYARLDQQVDELKRRMLLIAGYPTTLAESVAWRYRRNVSVDDMLDAAERIERRRAPSAALGNPAVRGKQSENILRLIAKQRTWAVARDGSLYPSTRGKSERINTKIARLESRQLAGWHGSIRRLFTDEGDDALWSRWRFSCCMASMYVCVYLCYCTYFLCCCNH